MNDRRKCRWCRNFINGMCSIADETFEMPDFAFEIDCGISDGELAEAIHEIMDSNRKNLVEAKTDEAYDIVVGDIIGEFEALVRNFVRDTFDNIAPGLKIIEPSTNDFYCVRFE